MVMQVDIQTWCEVSNSGCVRVTRWSEITWFVINRVRVRRYTGNITVNGNRVRGRQDMQQNNAVSENRESELDEVQFWMWAKFGRMCWGSCVMTWTKSRLVSNCNMGVTGHNTQPQNTSVIIVVTRATFHAPDLNLGSKGFSWPLQPKFESWSIPRAKSQSLNST